MDVAHIHAGECDRRARARQRFRARTAVRFQSTHPRRELARQDAHRCISGNGTAPHGSRHDGPRSPHREDPVDRQTKEIVRRTRRYRRGGRLDRGAKLLDSAAIHDRGVAYAGAGLLQRRAGHGRSYVVAHELEPLLVDQVALGQRYDAAADSEYAEYREVLARLRHHSFIGRHHQQCEIDPGSTRQHVAHERFVAGHVDHAQHAAVRHGERREAEVDRDAAPLLLLEPVRVHAGERAHESGLAVVDVSGRAEYHVATQAPFSHASKARSARPSET